MANASGLAPVFDADADAPFNAFTDILFGSILILFSVVATVGNTIVIFVFAKESVLRTTTNYFLMSLAFSDLLVGIVVMPFGIIERLNYGRWLFGRDLCDIWHAVDVMSCTASIMNLCCIAIERYQAIHDPIKYPLRPNKTRVYIGILIAWLCSAVISFPAIAWWRASDAYKFAERYNKTLDQVSLLDLSADVCAFTDSSEYLISSSLVSFYVPTACMLVLYYKIYRTAINVSRSYATGERSVAVTQRSDEHDRYPGSLVLRVHRGKTVHAGTPQNVPHPPQSQTTVSNCRTTQSPSSHRHAQAETHRRAQDWLTSADDKQAPTDSNVRQNALTHQMSVSSQDSEATGSGCSKMLSKSNMPTIQSMALNTIVEIAGRTGAQSTRLHVVKKLQGFVTLKQQFRRFAREQKAAKTLGLIIFLFIACWGPFFLCSLLIALQQLGVIGIIIAPETLPMVSMCVTWLGYANSCINCFAYPWAMRDFRRAIYKHVQIPLSKCLRLPLAALHNRAGSFTAMQRSNDRTTLYAHSFYGGMRSTASSFRIKTKHATNIDVQSTTEVAHEHNRNGKCLPSESAQRNCNSDKTAQQSRSIGRCSEEKIERNCQADEASSGVRQSQSPSLMHKSSNGPVSVRAMTSNTVHCVAEVTTRLALPYPKVDILPRRLLAEVMSMNGSLV